MEAREHTDLSKGPIGHTLPPLHRKHLWMELHGAGKERGQFRGVSHLGGIDEGMTALSV